MAETLQSRIPTLYEILKRRETWSLICLSFFAAVGYQDWISGHWAWLRNDTHCSYFEWTTLGLLAWAVFVVDIVFRWHRRSWIGRIIVVLLAILPATVYLPAFGISEVATYFFFERYFIVVVLMLSGLSAFDFSQFLRGRQGAFYSLSGLLFLVAWASSRASPGIAAGCP